MCVADAVSFGAVAAVAVRGARVQVRRAGVCVRDDDAGTQQQVAAVVGVAVHDSRRQAADGKRQSQSDDIGKVRRDVRRFLPADARQFVVVGQEQRRDVHAGA